MSVKCSGALWGQKRTHTHTHAQQNTPAPPASPLATAAVLQEAAVPLADQILSVTFPLINGHLLPPFSLHGYTLCLRSSNHLIAVTFNLIRAGPPRLCSPAWLLHAGRPPTCHQPAGETQVQANKQANEAVLIQKTVFFVFLQRLSFLPNFLWNSLIFKNKYAAKQILKT